MNSPTFATVRLGTGVAQYIPVCITGGTATTTDGPTYGALSGSTTRPFGVSQYSGAAGEYIQVVVFGSTKMISVGAASPGATLHVLTSGHVAPISSTSTFSTGYTIGWNEGPSVTSALSHINVFFSPMAHGNTTS